MMLLFSVLIYIFNVQIKKKPKTLFFALLEKLTPNLPDCSIASC